MPQVSLRPCSAPLLHTRFLCLAACGVLQWGTLGVLLPLCLLLGLLPLGEPPPWGRLLAPGELQRQQQHAGLSRCLASSTCPPVAQVAITAGSGDCHGKEEDREEEEGEREGGLGA